MKYYLCLIKVICMNLINAKFYFTLWIMYFAKLSMTVVDFIMSQNLTNTNVARTWHY